MVSLEPQTTSPPGATERPTSVRYGVLAFSVSMSVILYLDRMAISVPVEAIATDLRLSITEVGDSVAAFFWCYALLQVPAGWLGDRWGGRRALTLYVVAWSAAMVGLGLATSLLGLLLLRGLLGVGQAGAYATTASFLRRWIPLARRGAANSAVSLGGRAGGMLAPALTPQLMAVAAVWLGASETWRPVFMLYALIGFAWAALFWLWFRDEPRLHPRVNAAEIAVVEGDGREHNVPPHAVGAIPLRDIVTNPSIQLLALAAVCVNVGWIFLATWMPTYLIKVHGADPKWAGFYTSLAAATGMAGCLVGGLGTDWLLRRVGLPWARRIPGILGYGGAGLGFILCWTLDDMRAIVVMLVVCSFLSDFALGSIWASFQDIGGPYCGTVLGWSNMCGNMAAACAISIIPRLKEHSGWPAVFLMAASAYFVGAVAWRFVDTRRRIRVAGLETA
jgi:ACS family glucarate transporter-like MFS transporter